MSKRSSVEGFSSFVVMLLREVGGGRCGGSCQ